MMDVGRNPLDNNSDTARESSEVRGEGNGGAVESEVGERERDIASLSDSCRVVILWVLGATLIFKSQWLFEANG